MSKMLSKMNLISVVQQLPKEDIETIQSYVEMIEEENKRLLKTITYNEKCRRKMQKSLMTTIEKQKEVIDKLELENKVLKEQMVAMVKPNYTYGVR